MRVARESMRIIKGSTKWPMFLRVFLTLRKIRTASDVQVITHNNNKKKEKNYVSSTSDSWSNDSDCEQFDKRQKTKKKKRGIERAKTRKSKKEERLYHATLTARLTEK